MEKFFAILSNLIAFFMIISLVSACISPVIYNSFGVPSLFGSIEIKYSDYPIDATVIDYNISMKNTNTQGLIVNFTPDSSLAGFVVPMNVVLGAGEQNNANLQVNIAGKDKSGTLYVAWKCTDDNQMSEGLIYVDIKGRDSVESCLGTPTSCGMPGMCEDVTKSNGCYDGYFRHYSCESNTKHLAYSSCTSYCCGLVGGTCTSSPQICQVPHFSISLPVNITDAAGTYKPATITLYQPGTSIVVNTSAINGYGIILSPNVTVDFNMEGDSSVLNILFRDFNISKLSGTLRLSFNEVPTSIPDATLIKAYMISTSLSSFDGSLKFKYSGLPFVNEQGLAIYKCSSFNKTSNVCDGGWVKQSTTKDTVSDVASTEISSFSVYAFGESQVTTTSTTTTIQSTTTTAGSSSSNGGSYSGGGGGGGRTTTRLTTTTVIVQCNCDSWINSGCGVSPCESTQMKQQRTCTPTGCNLESQCAADSSCTAQQVNETDNNPQTTSGKSTGFFVLPDMSQYVYPISGLIIIAIAGIAIWKFNGRIRESFTSYKPSYSSRKSSRKGNVTVDIETPRYLEVKMKEQPKVETKPVQQPISNKEAKNRSIDDFRKRALQLDKGMKRK